MSELEVRALRDQVAALRDQVETLKSSPAPTPDKYARDSRMARIARDRHTVAALVAGGPEERCAIIKAMAGTSLRNLVEMMELATLITILRGMPSGDSATVALMNSIDSAQRYRVLAALMATEHLPALTAITNRREGSTFNMPGMAITAGCTALIASDLFSELSRKPSAGGSPEMNAALSSHAITFDDASEAQAREWVAGQLASGALVIGHDGKLTTPRPFGWQAEAEAERPINVRASLDRVRAADRKANLETTKQTSADQSSRTSAAERAKDREAARLARAICDEQDRRAAKQHASKRAGK